MAQFVDINNREGLRELLLSLDPETIPLWGKMKPQQMVEHLVEEVKWTNGKKIAKCDKSPEEAEKSKQRMVYTDTEISKNIFLEELPERYAFADIPIAVDHLMEELEDFDWYFKEPGVTSVHGGFGPLNHEEWVIYHGKHFTHHLKQFGLWQA